MKTWLTYHLKYLEDFFFSFKWFYIPHTMEFLNRKPTDLLGPSVNFPKVNSKHKSLKNSVFPARQINSTLGCNTCRCILPSLWFLFHMLQKTPLATRVSQNAFLAPLPFEELSRAVTAHGSPGSACCWGQDYTGFVSVEVVSGTTTSKAERVFTSHCPMCCVST